MRPRRGWAAFVLAAGLGAGEAPAGRFLTEEEAPAAVFAGADRFETTVVERTPALQEAITARLGGVTVSIAEERYRLTRAYRAGEWLGTAVIVEEIGKHRPITFVVGIRPDGQVEDVAVMAYREAYGGEIRQPRFLGQYRGKGPADDLRPARGIVNVAGATLSVEAASRAVRKAHAVVRAVREMP